MTRTRHHRPGVTAVESAVVLAVLLVMILAIIAGGYGVFRHQQAACLACEGARYASVRGADFKKDTDKASPTKQELIDAAIIPFAAGIDPAELQISVEWIDRGTGTVLDWDASKKDVRSLTPSGEVVSNAVRVTVVYLWNPGAIWGSGSIRSVCEIPMSE
jgi:Flp pilus assembly protein TadG